LTWDTGLVPFQYEIEGVPTVAVITAEGAVTLQEWESAMARLISDPAFGNDTPILLDARNVEALPDAGGPAVIAIRWRALVPRSRGAIVTDSDVAYAAACQVQSITDGRVRAFRERQPALDWLLIGRQPCEERKP
jgi:hypothetical protein